jgi:hypothetical protein
MGLEPDKYWYHRNWVIALVCFLLFIIGLVCAGKNPAWPP